VLAYVFWHRVSPGVDKRNYESLLIKFHEQLNLVGGHSLLGSSTYMVHGVQWMPNETLVYEDWYYLESSSYLDVLNDVAVSPQLREYHDRVASLSLDGRGALLGLKSGKLTFRDRDYATWLVKPRGTKYDEFYLSVRPLLKGRTLWRRLLAMGPSPEFCITGEKELDVGIKVVREMIFKSNSLGPVAR